MTRSAPAAPLLAALLGGVLLAGCTVRPPTGPTVLALPPDGKDLARFQEEEAGCRNYASDQTGISPTAGANRSVAGSAAVGTVLGTAAGALLGAAGGAAGVGAAIGAGTGLLGGSAVGANNARASSASLQARYDQSYAQCLASTGNQVQTAGVYGMPAAAPYAPSPYYGGYYGPALGSFYGPGYYRPGVSVGVGVGTGWGFW